MSAFSQNKFNRRTALSLLLGASATPLVAQEVTRSPLPIPRPGSVASKQAAQPKPPVDNVKKSGLTGATAFALGGAGGNLVASRTPQKQLPPASVAKIVTALYALEHLGDERRYVTRVLMQGDLVAGELKGDLILAGGGDPTLDTDGLGRLAMELRAAGVTRVTGRFLVYDKALPNIALIDQSQTEYAGYNPTISGLNLNYNRVHFEWKKQGGSYAFKLDARSKNYAPLVKVAEMKIVNRDLPVFDHSKGIGLDKWTVAQSALGNGGARWLPVRIPALYAGDVFQSLASGQGVSMPRAETVATLGEFVELARIESAPMSTLVKDMLKYSTNLTAEVLGITASRARGVRANSLAASAREMNEWAKTRFGLQTATFVDHSGLGDASKISPVDLVKMLSDTRAARKLKPLLKPVKMKDSNGKTVTAHAVSAVAKTGTLNFVSSLAGYVSGPNGKSAPFAILSADIPARKAAKMAGNEVPKGARSFNKNAKTLQQTLLEEWVNAEAL